MKHTALLILTTLLLTACRQPVPDPMPDPDPVEPITDPTLGPCEIQTADNGCLSLDRFNQDKAALVADYEADSAYSRHAHTRLGHVAAAWSNIRLIHGDSVKPGAGVKIGMIDDGIDLNHPGFAGATVTEYFFGDATKENTTTYGISEDEQQSSHGTAVASRIISNAQLDDEYSNFYGIAPAAHLYVFTLKRTNSSSIDISRHIDEIMSISRSEEVDILNISYGSSHIRADEITLERLPFGQDRIDAFIQADHEHKVIIVTGNGNDNQSQPTGSAGLPLLFPELRGHYITTALTDDEGKIAPVSNHCGLAAEWCISVPASDSPVLETALFKNIPLHHFGYGNGTSISTAYISGSLVLIKQQFHDQLMHDELVNRLFATADKTGIYADSTIYGQGLVDLDAATSPVGELRVIFDDQASAAMADTQVNLSPAFGDSLSQGLAGQEIAAFDNLNAPFFLSLSNLYRARTLSTPAALYRPGFTDPEAPMQFIDNGLGGHSNHLSLARNVIAANVSHNRFSLRTYASLTQPNEPSIAGAELAWKTPFIPLSLRIGSLFEQGSVLGTRPYGAWGDVNTTINYLSLEGRVNRHGWLLNADLQLGYAVPSLHSAGMIDHISPLVTSAFDISATRKLVGKHHIRLSVSQPLRIESGNAALIVPTGRQKNGAVTLEQLRTSLTPSGRQIDLATRLRGAFRLFNYDLSAAYSLDPVHRSSAPNEFRVQFSLQASY